VRIKYTVKTLAVLEVWYGDGGQETTESSQFGFHANCHICGDTKKKKMKKKQVRTRPKWHALFSPPRMVWQPAWAKNDGNRQV
jgi:hypothetical protein